MVAGICHYHDKPWFSQFFVFFGRDCHGLEHHGTNDGIVTIIDIFNGDNGIHDQYWWCIIQELDNVDMNQQLAGDIGQPQLVELSVNDNEFAK